MSNNETLLLVAVMCLLTIFSFMLYRKVESQTIRMNNEKYEFVGLAVQKFGTENLSTPLYRKVN